MADKLTKDEALRQEIAGIIIQKWLNSYEDTRHDAAYYAADEIMALLPAPPQHGGGEQ